jgi:HPr Serine kinase C-terminal domain
MLRYDMLAKPHMPSDTLFVRDRQRPMTNRAGMGTAVTDPLQAFVPLPFHHVLFPYGFPVQIKSNEPAVLRLAEQSWGRFQQRFRETPIEVRFLVSEHVVRRRPLVPAFRAQANLLTMVADAHNFACCDLAAGFGFACLTKGTVVNRAYVRYHFLEAMVYTLLDSRHLVAVHAACVMKDGHGVLLVGDSGAGKSSLAYACMRRGWTYVSDDASSLLRRRTGRVVVGNPQTFRFRPTASILFPELQGQIKVRNGKPTVEIRTENLRNSKIANECTVDYVIFLNRLEYDVSTPSLAPIPRDESLRRLCQENVWPIELSLHQERLEAIERLLDAQLFQLTYKAFGPAIDLLEQLVPGGKS